MRYNSFPPVLAYRLLGVALALLLGACSVASNSQLSPDREPDSPRYTSPSDTLPLPPDTTQRQ